MDQLGEIPKGIIETNQSLKQPGIYREEETGMLNIVFSENDEVWLQNAAVHAMTDSATGREVTILGTLDRTYVETANYVEDFDLIGIGADVLTTLPENPYQEYPPSSEENAALKAAIISLYHELIHHRMDQSRVGKQGFNLNVSFVMNLLLANKDTNKAIIDFAKALYTDKKPAYGRTAGELYYVGQGHRKLPTEGQLVGNLVMPGEGTILEIPLEGDPELLTSFTRRELEEKPDHLYVDTNRLFNEIFAYLSPFFLEKYTGESYVQAAKDFAVRARGQEDLRIECMEVVFDLIQKNPDLLEAIQEKLHPADSIKATILKFKQALNWIQAQLN